MCIQLGRQKDRLFLINLSQVSTNYLHDCISMHWQLLRFDVGYVIDLPRWCFLYTNACYSYLYVPVSFYQWMILAVIEVIKKNLLILQLEIRQTQAYSLNSEQHSQK